MLPFQWAWTCWRDQGLPFKVDMDKAPVGLPGLWEHHLVILDHMALLPVCSGVVPSHVWCWK